jgi:hypothetical protein
VVGFNVGEVEGRDGEWSGRVLFFVLSVCGEAQFAIKSFDANLGPNESDRILEIL